MRRRRGKQFGGAPERIWHGSRCRLRRVPLTVELGAGEDKASSNRVEDLLSEHFAFCIKSRETHSVGVGWLLRGGMHLIFVEVEMFRFSKGDRFAIQQIEGSCVMNGCKFGFDDLRIDPV